MQACTRTGGSVLANRHRTAADTRSRPKELSTRKDHRPSGRDRRTEYPVSRTSRRRWSGTKARCGQSTAGVNGSEPQEDRGSATQFHTTGERRTNPPIRGSVQGRTRSRRYGTRAHTGVEGRTALGRSGQAAKVAPILSFSTSPSRAHHSLSSAGPATLAAAGRESLRPR